MAQVPDDRELKNDFGELSYYREANAGLRPPAPGGKRIVFFGDSITEGWALAQFFPGQPFINRGICSQTTSQMLIRFRQDVVALKPRAVLIHAGTNNIGGNTGPMRAEDIEANLASMAEIARAGGIRVVFCALLPPSHDSTLISRFYLLKHPPDQISALNRWIRDYSAAHDCDFVDYHAAMCGAAGCVRPELSEDGLHPSPAGYAVMARAAQAAIGRLPAA